MRIQLGYHQDGSGYQVADMDVFESVTITRCDSGVTFKDEEGRELIVKNTENGFEVEHGFGNVIPGAPPNRVIRFEKDDIVEIKAVKEN